MRKQIKQLEEFHRSFKLPVRKQPTIIPENEFVLRHKLLKEEVQELKDAYLAGDLVEVADAIIDSAYVLIGTAVQMGFGELLESCFDEVHRSNMSKLDEHGCVILREDGKVMKSDLFQPPQLSEILHPKKTR